MNEILLANAALTLLEKLIPYIAQQVKRGAVSPDEQQKLHDRYTTLKAQGDLAFSGPEWRIEK